MSRGNRHNRGAFLKAFAPITAALDQEQAARDADKTPTERAIDRAMRRWVADAVSGDGVAVTSRLRDFLIEEVNDLIEELHPTD